MSLWVLGTDTSVGKSVVSAIILARYGMENPIGYWKPISTGGEADRDLTRVERWLGGNASEIDFLPETYCLEDPVSPHLAARRAGVRIERERVLGDLVRFGIEDSQRTLLIEGAGGLLVPLDDEGTFLLDLVAETMLPVLLVARSTLGTINHTLLSIDAMRAIGLHVVGVVLNGPRNADNRAAIEAFGRIDVIDEVEPLAPGWRAVQHSESDVAGEAIARAAASFDAAGRLRKYL